MQVAGGTTAVALAGCSSDGDGSDGTSGGGGDDTDGEENMDDGMEPTDPADASRASIDRFSEAAGTLHVRAENGDLPGADEPIDFDADFLTQGYGPDGGVVEYYDFDAQPTAPAPIYAFFRENGNPVADQLNVVGIVPGDEGYNDFWRVNKVTVPDEYVANTITSVGALMEAEYDIEINTNPGQEGGGPPSGFMSKEGSDQTHNVVATLPDDASYSPLWLVNIYDNADFEAVSDLGSATDAEILASGAANVNCPVVSEG